MKAQNYTNQDRGETYPVNIDTNPHVVSGFVPFSNMEDYHIFGNALLWTIEEICPKLREGIETVNTQTKTFVYNFTLNSPSNSEHNNTYYCKATFKVNDRKLFYYLSDILIESPVFVMKKITPIERLRPEKKESHKRTINDFVKAESLLLNKMFDFISENPLSPVTHWTEIGIGKPIKGMTEDECRLAFGKPQATLETNGEVQWMYSSTFYLFFKDGKVQRIIK